MFRFRHAAPRVPESVVLRLIPLVFLLGALFLGGGCSVGNGEGGHSVVRGSGYSCSGEMGTGSVTVRTADGHDVPGGSGAIDPETREFSVTLSGDVPMRFIVAVTGVETDGARQADASDSLMVSRLVENPSADMFVTVTPLTTLVARYALKTGASLAQAEHAIAEFIKLPPNVSPSLFLPGPYEYVFSFAKFLSEWTASGKTFDGYIDALVDEALSGATHPFPGLVKKGGGVFKWILEKIFDGATGAATEEGIGWVIDLIKGDDPMADIQAKLDEMSGQLDKIYAELVNFEVAMDELLRDMSMEADYNTMLPDISNIRTLYDEKLVNLPKYRDRDFARKEADEIESKNEDVMKGLDLINEKLTAPIVGTTFYAKLATSLALKVHGGEMTLDDALAQYRKVYTFLTGIQSKGLILVSEHFHLSKSPDDIKDNVTRWTNQHIDRIAAQSQWFLDGVEMLAALFTKGADCTIDYKGGFALPASGGSSIYPAADALVGDATNCSSQAIVRYVWDGLLPKDFSFMTDRMNKLAEHDGNGKGTHLPIRIDYYRNGSVAGSVDAVDKMGTVNAVTNSFITGATPTKTFVLRYVFRDLPMDTSLQIHPDETALAGFNPTGSDPVIPGTVGNFAYYENGRKIQLKVTDSNPYATAAFYGWLPKEYVHDGDDADGTFYVVLTYPSDDAKTAQKNLNFRIRSATRKYLWGPDGYAHSNGDAEQYGDRLNHCIYRFPSASNRPYLRYGDICNIAQGFEKGSLVTYTNSNAWYSTGYNVPTTSGQWVFAPVPSIVGRFVDASGFAVPRGGQSVYIKRADMDHYLKTGDNDGVGSHPGTDGQSRWIIEWLGNQ